MTPRMLTFSPLRVKFKDNAPYANFKPPLGAAIPVHYLTKENNTEWHIVRLIYKEQVLPRKCHLKAKATSNPASTSPNPIHRDSTHRLCLKDRELEKAN